MAKDDPKPIEIKKLSPDEAHFKLLMKAMSLQGQVREERDRSETWRKLANGYDDLRSWLRLCDDNPEGHAEFYKRACMLIFGSYGEDFEDAEGD